MARLLKKKKTANYIEKVQTIIGEVVYKTIEIAKTFQSYYGKLYSINKKDTPDEVKQKREKSKAFLNEICLNKIPEDKLSYLEAPITEEEILKILKESLGGEAQDQMV